MTEKTFGSAFQYFQNEFVELMSKSREKGLLRNIGFSHHDPQHYLLEFEIPENKHYSLNLASKYSFIIKVVEKKVGVLSFKTIGTNISSDDPRIFLYKMALKTHEIIQETTIP